MPSAVDEPRRVLCVACSSRALELLDRALRYSQLRMLTAATREKGVAVCVAETITLAVLDAESIRGEEGSVAKSLKAVRPGLPIIMLEERHRSSDVPDCVDAVVPASDVEKLLKTISGASEDWWSRVGFSSKLRTPPREYFTFWTAFLLHPSSVVHW